MTHDDGYSLYWPNGPEPDSFHHNNPLFKGLMQSISDHMFRMADTDIPEAYLMSDILPVITMLECQPEQWIRYYYLRTFENFQSPHSRLTFRGVAGAYLYTVNVDGDAIAILEDRQKEVCIQLSNISKQRTLDKRCIPFISGHLHTQ